MYGKEHKLVQETIKEVIQRLEEKEIQTEETVAQRYNIDRMTLSCLCDSIELNEINDLKKWMQKSKLKVIWGKFTLKIENRDTFKSKIYKNNTLKFR